MSTSAASTPAASVPAGPALPISPPPRGRGGRFFKRAWVGLKAAFETVKEIFSAALIISLFLYLIYLFAQATRPVVILDPISVPKQFADSGFTSEVVTRRVREQLEEIQRTDAAASPRDQLSMASDRDFRTSKFPRLSFRPR